MRWIWPAHDPFPALARRQPTARPILCLFAARHLPINRAGRRRAGPKSRASRAVRVPRRCLWTWQDDPAARAMRGASGRAWSLLHGLACCPPAASPSQSSCLPSVQSVQAVMGTDNAPLTGHLRVVRSPTGRLDTSAHRTRASRAASHHHRHSRRSRMETGHSHGAGGRGAAQARARRSELFNTNFSS